MHNETFEVTDEYEEERLDKFLAAIYPEQSRSFFQKLIKDGLVSVNDVPQSKANYRMHIEDMVSVTIPDAVKTTILPEAIPLDILYEDDDVIIVNKPKDMVVHPCPGHYSGTLVNAIMFHCRENLSGINGEIRPGIVHRIDKDTTGSLIICKNDHSHRLIAEQIKVHSVNRLYRGIVKGIVKEDSGTIEGAIGRHPKDRKKMAINERNGKPAITHYRIIERLKDATYMEFKLETGRTHQIRVHMKHIGHVLFNDERYGGHEILKGTHFSKYKQFVNNCFDTCPRQALHAMTLGFVHPVTGEEMYFTSELPDDMTRLIEKWRGYISNRELE